MSLQKLLLKPLLFAVCSGVLLNSSAKGAIIRLDNTGVGAALDEINVGDIGTVTAGPHATAIPGLNITVTALGADGTGEDVNTTATSLGINAGGPDDTDAFDSALNEFVTFRFDKAVTVSQLDFTTFDAGETFEFDGVTITNGDLSNGTLDTFDFAMPHAIAANADFTLRATTGTIGIEAFDVTVSAVPEPSSVCLLSLGAFVVFRRRRKQSAAALL